MTFGANAAVRALRGEHDVDALPAGDSRLEAKVRRLIELTRQRDAHFRRAVMADTRLSVMLSLFLAELQGVPLTAATLALITFLDDAEADRVLDPLIHAGLVVVTGETPDRRSVGLSPLGSARMRSFISDYPDN